MFGWYQNCFYLSIFDTFACKYNDAQHVTCCAFVVIKFVT